MGARVCARRPGLSGGLAAFGALFAVVASNAFYAQPGRHPTPLLATRLADGERSTAEAFDLGNDDALMPVPLVREVQAELAETGHYRATVDGKPGPATEAAIRAFQKERGLRVDGQPSPLLLTQIRQLTSEAPNPRQKPQAEQYASIEERMGLDQTGAIESRGAPAAPDQAGAIAELPQDELVRRIQSALTAAQVAELDADGIAGEQTRAAIRTFEALEGLEVTGSPDPRILKRLIEIGAAR